MKREKVLNTIAHRDGSLPWQFDMTSAFAAKVCDRLSCACAEEAIGNHMCRAKYKQNRRLEDGAELDIFGVRWVVSKDGGDVGIVDGCRLPEPEFGDYVFPEIRTGFARELAQGLASRTDGTFRQFSITMGFFERAWSLRGMEGILMDMIAEEAFATELFERIEAHHTALLDEVLEYDYEGLYFGDDWGQQQGLIMGPPLWRKYIKPGVSRLFAKAKAAGKKICLHSCGDLREIFPDLIEMGVDIYNTLQPEIYDLKAMKREYGADITFYGGISTQQFLPFASPAEVKQKTREVAGILGESGGYIVAPTHAVTMDVPVENVLAMLEAIESL